MSRVYIYPHLRGGTCFFHLGYDRAADRPLAGADISILRQPSPQHKDLGYRLYTPQSVHISRRAGQG